MARPSKPKEGVEQDSFEAFTPTQSSEADFSDAGIDFSPMDVETITRTYNEIDIQSEIGDIPEPSYATEAPTFDFDSPEFGAEQTPPEPTAFENMANPHMNDLGNKEKKIASEQLVNGIFEAYKVILTVGAKFSKIDENKVTEAIMKGEIDNNLHVPISEDGTEVNVLEYAQITNQQIDEVFKYNQGFEDSVKPAMIREFMKRGYGLTDIQYIMMIWAKELGTKVVLMFTLKKQNKMMLNHFATMSQQIRNSQASEPVVERVSPDSIQMPNKNEAKSESKENKDEKATFVNVEDIEAHMMDEE